MANEIQIENLKLTNYVRVAQSNNNFWVDFSRAKLYSDYTSKLGAEFNIILYSGKDLLSDSYIIPFRLLVPLFKDEYLANDKTRTEGSRRWIVTISNHIFKVTNCPFTVDVKDYFSNPYWLSKPDNVDIDTELEDYLQLVKVRQKQSKFRKAVLGNFKTSCCLSGINEEDLLVASHIIPWSHRRDTRLDKTNGLCLFILYDKLFDKGYFTIDNDYRVTTVKITDHISGALISLLSSIDGRRISRPSEPINREYLKYHRENIFIDRQR